MSSDNWVDTESEQREMGNTHSCDVTRVRVEARMYVHRHYWSFGDKKSVAAEGKKKTLID